MNAETTVSTSNRGRKATNEDFVKTLNYDNFTLNRFTVLIACDGVGGEPGGQTCARAVGKAVLYRVRQYLLKRGVRKYALTLEDAKTLAQNLQVLNIESPLLNIESPQEGSATTLSLLLIVRRSDREEEKRGGRNVIGIWAGDSRSYLLSRSGDSYQLTDDHRDSEGRVTAFYRGDGRVCGDLGVVQQRVDGLCAACTTTDGVHDYCTEDELYHFLLYSIDQQLQKSDRLSEELTHFLQENLSDNYSLALTYRPLSSQNIESTASQLLPSKYA
jgi:serine/threonine protein phosphatase PrpC